MPTKIYDAETIYLIDGTELYITPLKIKYMREFMAAFDEVKKAQTEQDAISRLSGCVLIAMKQYYPSIKTIEDLEDSIDLSTMYIILDISAGIKMDPKDREESEEPVKEQTKNSEASWEDLDLAKLESEAFLLGIWKDYAELEASLSMPELIATLGSKRELDYQEKKFLAAIQGVDIDKDNKEENAWEKMKAKVFSGGKATNSKDIVALQGQNAATAGFGIGMGLSYETIKG